MRFISAITTSTAEIPWEMVVANATPSTVILRKTTKMTFRITFTTPAMVRKIKGLFGLEGLIRKEPGPHNSAFAAGRGVMWTGENSGVKAPR